MNDLHRSFPSKLLLLGEYTVLVGAPALAVPFQKYAGKWIFDPAQDQRRLPEMLYWLKQQPIGKRLRLDAFQEDLSNGIYFKSNIPEGYGLGSSGALSAAIYHRYTKLEEKSLAIIREHLAHLEGFFHGSSSGLDPLVSYSQAIIYVNASKENRHVKLQSMEGLSWFLVDTRIERVATPFIQWFLGRLEDPAFEQICREQIAPKVDVLIQQLLHGVEEHSFFSTMQELSRIQRIFWTKLIPDSFLSLWDEGLKPDSPYTLKLCGAGGGGFILGLQRGANFETTNAQMAMREAILTNG